jgi:CRISPR/Cas system-associated exonuclease Cas4 (RecB family)
MVQRCIDTERVNSTWVQDHRGKLAVSEIGHCPRKAMLRLHGVEETDPFDEYTRRLLWSGKMAEAKLEAVLRAEYRDELQAQAHVESEEFRGTADFVVPGTVIEHKETAQSNFKYKRLPYDFHCLQVLAYKHLWKAQAGVESPAPTDARLYYQNRADWAEFRVWESNDCIIYEGDINGEYHTGVLETTLDAEMQKLVEWYRKNEVPPRYETPFEKQFACTRMYTKWKTPRAFRGCTYFGHCWPELGDQQSFTISEDKL